MLGCEYVHSNGAELTVGTFTLNANGVDFPVNLPGFFHLFTTWSGGIIHTSISQ